MKIATLRFLRSFAGPIGKLDLFRTACGFTEPVSNFGELTTNFRERTLNFGNTIGPAGQRRRAQGGVGAAAAGGDGGDVEVDCNGVAHGHVDARGESAASQTGK